MSSWSSICWSALSRSVITILCLSLFPHIHVSVLSGSSGGLQLLSNLSLLYAHPEIPRHSWKFVSLHGHIWMTRRNGRIRLSSVGLLSVGLCLRCHCYQALSFSCYVSSAHFLILPVTTSVINLLHRYLYLRVSFWEKQPKTLCNIKLVM